MYQKCTDKIPQSCLHKWYIFVIISFGRKENNDKYNFKINKKERRLLFFNDLIILVSKELTVFCSFILPGIIP